MVTNGLLHCTTYLTMYTKSSTKLVKLTLSCYTSLSLFLFWHSMSSLCALLRPLRVSSQLSSSLKHWINVGIFLRCSEKKKKKKTLIEKSKMTYNFIERIMWHKNITKVVLCHPAGKTVHDGSHSWCWEDARYWLCSELAWGEHSGHPYLSAPSQDTHCPQGCYYLGGQHSVILWLHSELPVSRREIIKETHSYGMCQIMYPISIFIASSCEAQWHGS